MNTREIIGLALILLSILTFPITMRDDLTRDEGFLFFMLTTMPMIWSMHCFCMLGWKVGLVLFLTAGTTLSLVLCHHGLMTSFTLVNCLFGYGFAGFSAISYFSLGASVINLRRT